MLRDIRKNKIFSRRSLVLGSAQTLLGAGLILRLSYLQIFKHKEYSIKSDSNSIKPIIKPAARGNIFDRYGNALTENNKNYRLLFYLNSKRNSVEIIEKIAEVLELPAEKKQILIEKVKNAKRKKVISLIESLDYRDLARIETFSHKLSGVSIESGFLRHYLYGKETAHFLGYVSLPSENEIDEKQQALFLHPDFRIGKSGIEKSFDEALRGKYGVKYEEVDVRENHIKTLSTSKDIEGSNISLTIDLELQKYVSKRIKDIVASVVVMHVETGEILAYASSPSFNPNEFVEGVSEKYWKELIHNPRKPLHNKPISALYPPGSPFKLITAIAALESDINPLRKVFCNGRYMLGRRTFHCWKKSGHGNVNMSDAIKHSCNSYFYTIANEIGYEKITEVAKRFGYAQKVDISLYGSKTGLVANNDWMKKYFKRPWQGGDTLNISIGQGSLLATPIQMALVTAKIANGGVPIKPYLVKNHNIDKQFEELKNQTLVKDDYLKIIQEGMNRVLNEQGGTAYFSRISERGFEMAGKTGTAQVISKRESQMSAYEKSNLSNHAIFVGFAPVSSPKYAISVVVEHGGSGSGSAAPVARDIMMVLQGLK